MTNLQRPVRSLISREPHALFKINGILFGIMGIALGICVAHLLGSPGGIRSAISILVFIALLLVIIHNPLHGFLACLVLEPFIETQVKILMGAGLPDLSFSRLTIVFLVIVMLARAAKSKFQFEPLDLADICIILTTVGIIISTPLSGNPVGAVQIAISWHFTPLLAYFFAKNLVQDKEDLNKLLLAVMILGFVVALYAIYEQVSGNIMLLPEGKIPGEFRTDYTENLRMIRGLMGSPGNFGRVLISTIPITFYLFFEAKPSTRKALLSGILAVQICGIYFTYNRTCWFALTISLFILQFFYPQFRRVFFVMIFIAAGVLWAAWSEVRESIVVKERVFSEVSTLEDRMTRWQAGYKMWKAKPVRGWGHGRYKEESGRFGSKEGGKSLRAIENDYLYVLVASGMIGFLPYLVFLLAPLINSVRLFFKARAPDWRGFIKTETIALYWCIILSFGVGSFTQIQTEPVVKMIPFALAGAVVGTHGYCLRRPKGRNRSSAPLPAATAAPENEGHERPNWKDAFIKCEPLG